MRKCDVGKKKKIEGGKTESGKRDRNEGSDSTERRAGSCQSGLLQQECSSACRMEAGREGGRDEETREAAGG